MPAGQEQIGTKSRHRIAAGRNEGENAVISRLPGAIVRAALMVLLIATPTAMLAGHGPDHALAVIIIAIFAALFTLVEYTAASPSLVEFRGAPPFNRLRFGALLATVFVLSLIAQPASEASNLTRAIQLLAERVGSSVDFQFSPVHNLTLMMPQGTPQATLDSLRTHAGVSYIISLLSIAVFVILLRLKRWPNRRGTFNVWVNLPTFDPTTGGDVVARLNRDSTVNLILGFLLPFLIPAVIKLAGVFVGPMQLNDPQTMIWMVTAWAFLPASLLMRGVALSRVAQLIYTERKRAYKQAVDDGLLSA